jgi:hypothetical protein
MSTAITVIIMVIVVIIGLVARRLFAIGHERVDRLLADLDRERDDR